MQYASLAWGMDTPVWLMAWANKTEDFAKNHFKNVHVSTGKG